ncbi:STAS domain-containing protein [Acetobacterium wieringae]|jgi:anti-sigma B factor antagonist|uniref:Anti-sigma factor antagonist n=2 Tax=Eubacteriaceae TaxID=186806 RepID=A0A1F2PF84_9FIRM|nr:STAS domain-containing protein [Acetobacterium wieringae]OXS25158.1 MAG: anti-sigma B factor antagonist [Acetobacterium sp. MES1]MEA4804460.1 STAS domain-containing protein [Acetobacterium wieringae]OFV69938.1 putative anti-sigma factor antagonist [Acetobacterium wieringae]TYC85869.1 STAS domain-containing protein [Acetobacterium wieringae]UYO63754.1 STAS domain-containing protein [Acetobacterium wieringae]
MSSNSIIEMEKTSMVSIKGEIDIYSIEKFREIIEEKIRTQAPEIILDCSELSYMDSTGMGVLIELRNKTKEMGQKIIMINPRPNIKKLLSLTGVDKIIEIVDNPVN